MLSVCLTQTYLDLSVSPSYHQLLRQCQLAIETLDGLFCFLSKRGAIVGQKIKCLLVICILIGPQQVAVAGFLSKLLLVLGKWLIISNGKITASEFLKTETKFQILCHLFVSCKMQSLLVPRGSVSTRQQGRSFLVLADSSAPSGLPLDSHALAGLRQTTQGAVLPSGALEPHPGLQLHRYGCARNQSGKAGASPKRLSNVPM